MASGDLDAALDGRSGAAPAAMHGVPAQQVRERAGVGEVVDRDELERGLALRGGAHHEAADAPEAVDADADSHASPPDAVSTRAALQRSRAKHGKW